MRDASDVGEDLLALFQRLPGLLELPYGQARVVSTCGDGVLRGLEVREFRIPASRLARPRPALRALVSDEARAALEQIAARLDAAAGDAAIVAEYKDRRLVYVDVARTLDLVSA